MSIDTILVVAAVLSMFVTFAGVLMWGDLQTRPVQQKVGLLPEKRSPPATGK
jgi:hypothetical protein